MYTGWNRGSDHQASGIGDRESRAGASGVAQMGSAVRDRASESGYRESGFGSLALGIGDQTWGIWHRVSGMRDQGLGHRGSGAWDRGSRVQGSGRVCLIAGDELMVPASTKGSASPRLCPEPPSRMNSLYINGWKAFDDSLRVPVQTTKQRRPDGTCDKCERRPYSSLKRCMMTAYLQRLAGIAARFRVSRTTKSKKKKSSGRVSGMRRRGSGMKDPESGIRFLGSLSGHLHHTYAPAFAFASASTYRWASLFIYLC